LSNIIKRMEHKLHIVSSQIVFSFRKNPEIRKRIFEFEDFLKNEFKIPFKSIPVPDDIEPNIPRFESQSVHGHSRIQVSQTRITLATSYNESFNLDYKQVEEYILNKSKLTSKLAESENIDFIAYIIELGVFMEEDKINSFIQKNTGIFAVKNDCKDFSLLYSKVFENNFYLNIKCSKFVEQELFLHYETKTFRPTRNLKHGISIVIDVNTKPYFELNKKFEKSLYNEINKEVFHLINNKNVESFLKGDI
jgi:hypothetical protein